MNTPQATKTKTRYRLLLVTFTLTLGLAIAYATSPALRVLLFSKIHDVSSPEVKKWALRRLASEKDPAIPILIRLVCKSLVPSSEEAAVWEAINESSERTRLDAIRDLLANPAPEIAYENMRKLNPPKRTMSEIIALLNSENPTVREETWNLFLKIAGNIGLSRATSLPTGLKLLQSDAKRTFFTSQSCPEFNHFYALLLGDPEFGLLSKTSILEEICEPYFVRQTQTHKRSFTATVTPYVIGSNLQFVNTHQILTFCYTSPDAWNDVKTSIRHPLFVDLTSRVILNQPTPQDVASSLCTIFQSHESGLIYTVQQMTTKRRQAILQSFSRNTALTREEKCLQRFLECEEIMEMGTGTEIVDKTCEVFAADDRPLNNLVEEFDLSKRGFLTIEECLNRLSEHCENERYSPAVLSRCMILLNCGLFALKVTKQSEYAMLLNSIDDAVDDNPIILAWLKSAGKEDISRFISHAQTQPIDISTLAKTDSKTQFLTPTQQQTVIQSNIRCDDLQKHTARVCAAIVADTFKRSPQDKAAKNNLRFNFVAPATLASALVSSKSIKINPLLQLLESNGDWKVMAEIRSPELDSCVKRLIKQFPNASALIFPYLTILKRFAQNYPAKRISSYEKLVKEEPGFMLGIPVLDTTITEKIKIWRRCDKSRFPVMHTCVGIDLGIEPEPNSPLSLNKTLEDSEAIDIAAEYFARIPCNTAVLTRRMPYILAICNDLDAEFAGPLLITAQPQIFSQISPEARTQHTKNLESDKLQILGSLYPEILTEMIAKYETLDLNSRKKLIDQLVELQFIAAPVVPQIASFTQHALQKRDFVETAMLISALTKIDRSGKTTIPLLIKLAKNKSLSYVYRAIGVCGLRRYYYLNRTQTDLKQLIAMLNGDLKTLAERSLERVTELREEEL